MANKYVDIQVLQYAVQSLSQAITNTFAMKNVTVTSLDIVKAIPTLLVGVSTEQVFCIRVTYADNGFTLKDGTVVSHIIDIALSDIISDSKLKIEVAADLPSIVDPQENTLYLVSNSAPDTNDIFDEYIYTDGNFELIGHTKLDLSAYITTADVDTKLADYYTKTETDGLIPDVSNFITDTEVDTKLTSYAKSADVYTKTEVDGLIPNVSDYIKESEVDTKLTNYYKKTEVDGLIPDVSNFVTDSDVDTKLGDYYKKSETYSKTETDTKFNDYYKKTETYSKTEADNLLKDKANQTDLDAATSKIAMIFSSMVDNTTLDGIIQDIRVEVADKLEDSDLNVIRSDIKILQADTKDLKDKKLDKTALPLNVSAFNNDANYQTGDDVNSTVSTSATKTLDDAKKYVNERITAINTLDPNDFYNKNQVDNKFHDYYLKTETYTKTEIDSKLDDKATWDTATDEKDGLLSKDLYSIIKQIDPDSLGLNGQDGLTPEVDVKVDGRVKTITFTTGEDVKSFTLTDGADGAPGKDGKNGTNGTNGTNGISFTGAKIDANNHLIITLSNGSKVDVGNVNSEALEITNIALDSKNNLIITLSDGSKKNLGNVKGEKGRSISKVRIDDTTHEIIVTYDDGTFDNAGMIEGVKGDKGDKGDKGESLKSITVDENEHVIITYSDGSTSDIGTIVGSKGTKGDKGDPGTSISKVEGKNNKLIVTLSDGQKFDLGNYVGPEGRGIKSIGINGNYELIITMSDGTIINTGALEVNVKDIFVTKAELNDEGELIFTFSDGSTQNNGKINGAEGFSIREYVKLNNGQKIKAGCMMLWENMIYKVVTDFTCTTNFNIDKANMQKITTDATLIDLYNAYVAGLDATETPLTFDKWMGEWMEQKFDNPIVSYATVVNRTSFGANAVYNLTYKDCVGGNTFNNDIITLPDSGTYILELETPYYGNANASGYRYSYIYNLQTNKYIYDECIQTYSGTAEYRFAYPSIRAIISGEAGDKFQIKVKNRNATTYTTIPENKVYLYKLVTPNHVVNVHDLYTVYLNNTTDENPMTEDEWVKHLFNKDSFRIEAVFNQSYTDATDVLLTDFSFSNGNEDMMCDDSGRFYAPYSGLYYLRFQTRLDKSNNYPSRFYLVKNGIYGEEGYSVRVIGQSTEGYQTNTAFLQTLNSVFWMTKGDYFTIGFQTSVKDTNTLKTISNGFEYGLVGGGSGSGGSGSSDGGSASAGSGIQLYTTLGIGSLVRTNAVVQYQRRLYRVVEDFYCTDVFNTDRKHMQQFYGSGHGITDYDDNRIDHSEEFLPGEFIIKRHEITAIDQDELSYTKDVDDLYEVVTPFVWSGNFDYDKVNLKKILGSFDDYDTVIKKLEDEIAAINKTNSDLEDIIDDLASILDDINRTVV